MPAGGVLGAGAVALLAAATVVATAPAAAAPAAIDEAVPATAPRVGECFDLADDILRAGGWWGQVRPVDCSAPHTFEVTETGLLPQDVNAFAFAQDRCGPLDLWAGLGVNTPMAGLVQNPIRIEPRSFGVREQPASYVCGAIAVSMNGRRASTAVELTSSVDGLSRRQRAALRHCSSAANGRRALAPDITVPCSTRPRWQERTWVLWTAFYDEYPGRSRLLARAAELCGPGARFSVPSAAAWEEGLPMTRCHRKYP